MRVNICVCVCMYVCVCEDANRMMVFGLVNVLAFKHLLVSRYWQSWWCRLRETTMSLSWIFHLILPCGGRRRWWFLFSYIYTYIHIVAVVVAESNILEEYERRFWGWPLSKENNGSSNVQLTVSVSVLYPIIMTSKFYLVFISLPTTVSKLWMIKTIDSLRVV